MTKLSGGCLCGAVRYEATVDQVRGGICHCTSCQKISGSAFSVNVFVPNDKLTGNLANAARYTDTSPESGRSIQRLFCKTCGSSLGSEAEAFPGMLILKAGTLDDSSAVKPDIQVWTRSKQHWLGVDLGIPGMPKGRGG